MYICVYAQLCLFQVKMRSTTCEFNYKSLYACYVSACADLCLYAYTHIHIISPFTDDVHVLGTQSTQGCGLGLRARNALLLRYDAIRYDTIRYDTIRYDTIRYDTTRHDSIRYDTIRDDTSDSEGTDPTASSSSATGTPWSCLAKKRICTRDFCQQGHPGPGASELSSQLLI